MGGGKGGGTSTTNNISKTEIPPEVLARYNAVNARAEAVAQQPYQRYSNDPNAFVAGLTPTQQAGIQNTNIMAGAAQPFYGAATGQLLQAQQAAQPYLGAATAGTIGGAQAITPDQLNVGQYLNPFTQSVVGATQAAMNQQQAQQLAQQQSEAIRGGAFGGDRAGLQRQALRGQQALAQAQAIAPLYQTGYQQALQTGLNVAQSNRQALQQMSQQLANLGQQGYGMGASTSAALGQLGAGAQQAGLAGAQAQLQAGQAQQQTEQAGKQAMYNQFMQEQGYPFQVAQFLANIATGTGALSGNTTAGTSTTTTQGGGGFFSDERLKENIKKVGETNDGQPIYRYNYKGDPRTQIGLMAQDVEKKHPEAVGLAGGYKTVDYKKATDGAVRKADGGGLMPQMLTPEIEAGDTSPEFEAGDVTPENMDAAYSTSTPNPISGWGPRQDAAVALRGSWRDLPASRLTNTPDDRNSSLSGEMWRAPGARYGRATGGTTDAYTINPAVENSQMLDRPAGLGALTLPRMVTGAGIPVRSMTPASEIEAMRAPKATGLSLGSIPAAIAARDTLGSALTGGNEEKLNMGSGRGYIQSEYDRLGKFLEPYGSQYSSQGGLVGPEGGAFARGGYAFGGGPYGVELTPMQQRQVLQGTPMSAPQVQQRQADPLGDATKVAGLVSGGYKLYKDRPDFLRSAEDVAKRKQEEIYREKVREEYLKKHGVEPEKVAELTPEEGFSMPEYAARGGLIGNRDGFYGRGYVNPDSYISGVLEDQSQAPPPRKLASNAMDFSKPQKPQGDSGALGQLTQMASLGKNLYSGGNWAAGKLGLGASPTAMSATSTGVIPEVIDMTSVPLTSAPLIEGAAAADAAAAAAGATGAAEGLGLMGTLGTVGEGIMAALPFLGFLSDERAKHDIKKVGTLFDGQPVYRFAYDGDDKTQMGLLAQKVEKARPEAVGLAGGMKTVDYEKATDKAAKRGHYQAGSLVEGEDVAEGGGDTGATGGDGTTIVGRSAPLPRLAKTVPTPADAVAAVPVSTPASVPAPAPRIPGVASGSRPSIPDVGGIVPKGVKDTLSSENFWVPAIAGIGSMLASPNKTLLGAVGAGLVGGTTAYTDLQKMQSEIAKREAETRGLDVINYQRSIQQTPAGNIVWLANGGIMLLGDYDALSKQGNAPPLLGRIPDNADVRLQKWLIERNTPKPLETPAPKTPTVAPPKAPPSTVPAPAPSPAPATPKTVSGAPATPAETPPAAAVPATPEPKKLQPDYDEKSKELADSERAIALNAGPAAETAKDLTKRYVGVVAPAANAARDSQKYLGELASNLADATKGKGLDAPGFGFSGRAQFVNALNTLSRAFGGSGDFGQADSIDQINNKIETLQASISAAGGNQESVTALNLLKRAVAGPSMNPRAYSQLAGDLLSTNQRAIDRDVHMAKYAKDSNGLLANAAQDFDRTHDPAMYKREGDAVAKMILTQPELIKDLRSGKYTSQQIDEAFAKQGLRNMSRYFVGRT